MIWIFAFAVTFASALFVVDKLLSAPKYNEDNSDHFDGKKFVNPDDAGTHHYGEVLKWWLSGNDKGIWHDYGKDDLPDHPAPEPSVDHGNHRITFINHATFLIQVNGQNILTDPVWSFRASPYQWIGPKRKRPAGIDFEKLPHIDTVLLSHNHYDHLDIDTVKHLQNKFDPQFIVPLGVERYLHSQGVDKTIRMDWWDKYGLGNDITLTAVPARHFSGRGLFDRNKTLWCGYVLEKPSGNIYFAGDTGYGDFLKEIKQQVGPINTSILPIGAYKPRWFMEVIHMSPEEAVKAHQELESERSIGMHFGTFPMADDGMYEPLEDLGKACRKHKISEKDFMSLEHGESCHSYVKQPNINSEVA
ncbi:MBL fold metallo-hydrolase [Fodinibius sp.]|uniref:MBL fold metallo-hydrolase n=1 Tax=Fodinibius sp. TaxID=1872440 RepID=UPI002ACEBC76|nr:MBL fold metallo-hydrolase [Fodinibius sp.]MDZ7658922.1 MBL fold metallo-hydrolase [Fodinibius sp.]